MSQNLIRDKMLARGRGSLGGLAIFCIALITLSKFINYLFLDAMSSSRSDDVTPLVRLSMTFYL